MFPRLPKDSTGAEEETDAGGDQEPGTRGGIIGNQSNGSSSIVPRPGGYIENEHEVYEV